MKKLFMAAGAAALMAACSQPRAPYVDNPDVAGANNSSLDITRVETTDSTTVLYFNVSYRPGWWVKISPESYVVADGDTARLISAEGIEPGAEHRMPENGKDSFILTFGPLPASAKTLTFSEGNGGWTMWGVDLTGRRDALANVPASVLRAGDSGEFIGPVQEVADTKYTVHIIDYSPELGNKLPVIINGLGGISFNETVTLNDEGIAEFTAPVYGSSILGISLGESFANLLVAPGEPTDVYIDSRITTTASRQRLGKEPMRYTYDNGRYAWFNKNNPEAMNNKDEFSIKVENAWQLTPEQYTDSLISAYQQCRERINNYMTDETMRQYMLNKLDLDLLYAAEAANNQYINSYYMAHQDFDGRPSEIEIEFPGTKAVAPVLEIIDINNPALTVIPEYGWIAADIPQDLLAAGSQSAEVALFREMFENASELTEEDMERVSALSNPFYAKALAAHAKVTKEKLEALKSMMQPTPEVAPDKVFDAIVAPHKGKVVMVDLWNTWCGPCRRALQENEPLKTGELDNDEIVWIYIADTSSDPSAYADMIPNIEGLHYMVNDDEISAIRKRFEVDGIPYYILVDRQGNATGRPDLRDHTKYVEAIKAAL